MRVRFGPVLVILTLVWHQPSLALDFPVASCKSWDGTVSSIEGTDTPRASMSGTVTRPDIQEYCHRDPGGETRQSGGKLSTSQCVENYVREVGKTDLVTEANCATGTLSFRYGTKVPVRARFPLGSNADTSCASGMPPLVKQFKMLCPTSAARMRLD